MYNTAPVAALEPSNGYYDSLDRAIQNERYCMLAPGQEVVWAVKISLGAIE
jgi:hypothetical protein